LRRVQKRTAARLAWTATTSSQKLGYRILVTNLASDECIGLRVINLGTSMRCAQRLDRPWRRD
jgi:hypothetical protein